MVPLVVGGNTHLMCSVK